MTARRALLVSAAAASVAALALPAVAQTSGSWSARWTGGQRDGMSATGDFVNLAGEVTFSSPGGSITSIEVVLTPTGDLAAGCSGFSEEFAYEPDTPQPPPTTAPTTGPTTPDTPTSPTSSPTSSPPTTTPRAADDQTFLSRSRPVCNGVYDVEVTAGGQDLDGQPQSSPPGLLTLTGVRVSIRPASPGPTSAVAGLNGAVIVRWEPPAAYAAATTAGGSSGSFPPDFLGYVVERAAPGGSFTRIATVDGATTSFTDTGVTDPQPGDYAYRVSSARQGASEGEVVLSSPGAPATVALSQAPTTPTTRGTGGGLPGAGAGGARPAPAAPVVDEGFDDELDFSDFEPGLEEAVPPDDASNFFSVGDEIAGAGLLKPFATALLLFVWAIHLRYLSRRANETLPVP